MKIRYNAPVTLTFSFIAIAVLLAEELCKSVGYFGMMDFLFCTRGNIEFSFSNPMDYFRLFSHALGHANWQHLIGNLSLLLLLAPNLEEKLGSFKLLAMILVTASITGIFNALFFSSRLLGASGIVFMMILLSSITNCKTGELPLTFILVAILYLGSQVVGMFIQNNVSEFGHLIGGTCGALFGFLGQRKKNNDNAPKKDKSAKTKKHETTASQEYISLDDI